MTYCDINSLPFVQLASFLQSPWVRMAPSKVTLGNCLGIAWAGFFGSTGSLHTWTTPTQTILISLSLCFSGHFPGGPGLLQYQKCLHPGFYWSQGYWRWWWWQLELQDIQSSSIILTTDKPTPSFLQAGCPSCRPTNSEGKIIISTRFNTIAFYFLNGNVSEDKSLL